MPFTKEQLAQITKLAELLYSPAEIAEAMRLQRGDVMREMEDEESDFRQAYNEGYYTSDIMLRTAILKLARDGSSPAQTMALNIKEKLDIMKHYG